jgi:hypothetical protein
VALVVSEDVEISTDGVTADLVLRAFDVLRRRLAVRATGSEGGAAGFSSLSWDALPSQVGRLTTEAIPIESGERWQRVEYRATFCPREGAVPRLVAVGIGQTVALRSRAAVET